MRQTVSRWRGGFDECVYDVSNRRFIDVQGAEEGSVLEGEI